MPTIVVVGAGVSGLTCALQLAKQKGNVVTVVAKHMPGDYDIEYTSPWAGANVLPMALEKDSRWEKQTWPELSRLAKEVPEAGIHYQTVRVLRRTADASTDFKGPFSDGLFALNPWFKTLMPDYHDLPAASLPPGIHSASEFTSVCINTAVYLPWLAGQCAAHGVVLRRAVLSHIAEAASLSHSGSRQADIIINASGLLACKLGGVMDSKVHARRGQTVLVRNEAGPVMMCMSGTKDGAEEMCYTMTRALGGGGRYWAGRISWIIGMRRWMWLWRRGL
ncbi:hypothetical protein B0T17DRAFT_613501 [Bombardia bombarda]|uniref:FAD dependent oxidoreductase domain-containing protein n=1 Tax=Bombardia bombarda TaxID=252184 RepID=A0AA39XML9_9PEZI|nr:hypothetical protein B0T17DRAFT_613501 [Bombardia bombarda]